MLKGEWLVTDHVSHPAMLLLHFFGVTIDAMLIHCIYFFIYIFFYNFLIHLMSWRKETNVCIIDYLLRFSKEKPYNKSSRKKVSTTKGKT